MKWFNTKNRTYHVQAYGKLPIYKDYINVVTQSESVIWRNWMLDTFGTGNIKIPKGVWGFIFQGTLKSAPIAGLIEQSSDGIREFPISLFTVMENIALTDRNIRHQVVDILKQLITLRSTLKQAEHVETCYDIITANILRVKNTHAKKNGLSPDVRLCSPDSQTLPPLFLVLPDLSGSPGFAADAKNSRYDIIDKWRALS